MVYSLVYVPLSPISLPQRYVSMYGIIMTSPSFQSFSNPFSFPAPPNKENKHEAPDASADTLSRIIWFEFWKEFHNSGTSKWKSKIELPAYNMKCASNSWKWMIFFMWRLYAWLHRLYSFECECKTTQAKLWLQLCLRVGNVDDTATKNSAFEGIFDCDSVFADMAARTQISLN